MIMVLRSLGAAVTLGALIFTFNDDLSGVQFDGDEVEAHRVAGKSGTEIGAADKTADATVPPCWGLNGVGDVWVGTCVDVVEVCGGSMAIAVVDLVGVPEEGMKFGRGGGDGFPIERAQCRPYGEGEEDLDGAVSEVFERLGLPVPVVVSEPEGLSLVNVENYVRGVVDDFDTTVELLDQDVRIAADPVVWSWDMGDGTT